MRYKNGELYYTFESFQGKRWILQVKCTDAENDYFKVTQIILEDNVGEEHIGDMQFDPGRAQEFVFKTLRQCQREFLKYELK